MQQFVITIAPIIFKADSLEDAKIISVDIVNDIASSGEYEVKEYDKEEEE
jgi:hypothetical protein